MDSQLEGRFACQAEWDQAWREPAYGNQLEGKRLGSDWHGGNLRAIWWQFGSNQIGGDQRAA